MKIKINKGHYLELMDRLYIQSFMVETFICNHPLAMKKKKVKKLVDDACMLLAEAYQKVGELDYKKEEKNNPIEKVVFRRRKKPKN